MGAIYVFEGWCKTCRRACFTCLTDGLGRWGTRRRENTPSISRFKRGRGNGTNKDFNVNNNNKNKNEGRTLYAWLPISAALHYRFVLSSCILCVVGCWLCPAGCVLSCSWLPSGGFVTSAVGGNGVMGRLAMVVVMVWRSVFIVERGWDSVAMPGCLYTNKRVTSSFTHMITNTTKWSNIYKTPLLLSNSLPLNT